MCIYIYLHIYIYTQIWGLSKTKLKYFCAGNKIWIVLSSRTRFRCCEYASNGITQGISNTRAIWERSIHVYRHLRITWSHKKGSVEQRIDWGWWGKVFCAFFPFFFLNICIATLGQQMVNSQRQNPLWPSGLCAIISRTSYSSQFNSLKMNSLVVFYQWKKVY